MTLVRKGTIGGIIAACVAAAVGGYFLVLPLFIVTEVNEPVPTEAAMQKYQEFIAMREEDRMPMAAQMSEEEKTMIMTGAAQVIRIADESMAEMSEQEIEQATIKTVRTGSFVGVGGHQAEGVAKILSVNDAEYLRFEEFMVINGPDLRVYLTSGGDVHGGEHLGKLKGGREDQNYSLAGIDNSQYDTVVIYCQPFGVVFATAALR